MDAPFENVRELSLEHMNNILSWFLTLHPVDTWPTTSDFRANPLLTREASKSASFPLDNMIALSPQPIFDVHTPTDALPLMGWPADEALHVDDADLSVAEFFTQVLTEVN